MLDKKKIRKREQEQKDRDERDRVAHRACFMACGEYVDLII